MRSAQKPLSEVLFANCGAKVQLFVELAKFFLYFCRKYLSKPPLFPLSGTGGEVEPIKKLNNYEVQQTQTNHLRPTLHGHGFHRPRRAASRRHLCDEHQKQYPAVRRTLLHRRWNSRIYLFHQKGINFPPFIYNRLTPEIR